MKLFIALLLTALLSVAVYAQTLGGDTPQPAVGIPLTKEQMWMMVIAAFTPIIVQFIRRVVPTLPLWALPASTPIIGVLLGLFINWLAGQNLAWVDMTAAGSMAVFVREVWNQAVTKQLAQPLPPPASIEPPKPEEPKPEEPAATTTTTTTTTTELSKPEEPKTETGPSPII